MKHVILAIKLFFGFVASTRSGKALLLILVLAGILLLAHKAEAAVLVMMLALLPAGSIALMVQIEMFARQDEKQSAV